MVIDHIGIVVSSLEEGIIEWQSVFGYTLSSAVVTNSLQRVRVVFLSKSGSLTVKLLEPSDPTSSVTVLARKGGGLHHICFRCSDLTTQLETMVANGARVIVPPQPGEAFEGHDIAFVFAKGNLNVELIDTEVKSGWVLTADRAAVKPEAQS